MTRATSADLSNLLLEMLTFKRPAWSKTERQFITRYLEPLGVTRDGFGNYYKRIGDAPILWSSHTDTVHTQGGRQTVMMVDDIARSYGKNTNCLGADCTAGVFLMAEMIKANIPGLYIFHRAEEIGGCGSSYIAEDTPQLLDGIKYAVAFDRRDTNSIITHQAGGRCCSEAFSVSLSNALGLGHTSDDGGTFTDTANYMGLVSECTNLSVGYYAEHSSRGRLDVAYLMSLIGALLRLDIGALVAERDPTVDDWGDDDTYWRNQFDQSIGRKSGDMLNLVRDNPHEVADFLEQYGVDVSELAEHILSLGGVIRKH